MLINILNLKCHKWNKCIIYLIALKLSQIKYKKTINMLHAIFFHENPKYQLKGTLELKLLQKKYKKVVNLKQKKLKAKAIQYLTSKLNIL